MSRRQPSLAVGVTLVVALIAACAPFALGPRQSPPSELAIVAGLAPGTFASTPPGTSLGSLPPVGPATTSRPALKAGSTPRPASAPTTAPTPATALQPAPKATPKPTPKPTAVPVAIPPLSHCQIFPSSNQWNEPVDSLPVASNSATMIAAIGLNVGLHPDFDAVGDGIPYNVVGSSLAVSDHGCLVNV